MDIIDADYLDFEITDTESFVTALSRANVIISQIEPGRLQGHHLRVPIPCGQISWIKTNLSLRGRGRFSDDKWTLSVVTGSVGRSFQNGIEVKAGSIFYHRPGSEHDGFYGRDFSVVCLGVREDVFWDTINSHFPELSDRLDKQWQVVELDGEKRGNLLKQFDEAARIVRGAENVRGSLSALSVMQDEMLGAFLDALADGVAPSPMPALSNAAELVRRAEVLTEDHVTDDVLPLRVEDLCIGCGVPRRTLNHAFQQVLGMGPMSYLRRLNLNNARLSLRRSHAIGKPKSVTEIALDNGFWHLGRFSAQYREMFGENPHES